MAGAEPESEQQLQRTPTTEDGARVKAIPQPLGTPELPGGADSALGAIVYPAGTF